MTISNNDSRNKKKIVALIAAFGMTILMGILILAVGVNILFFNTPSVALAAGQTNQTVDSSQTTVQQLQDQISQYQAREVQYKSELKQATDSLNQANQQIQQYKQLTQALIDAGVIEISADGRVTLGRALR